MSSDVGFINASGDCGPAEGHSQLPRRVYYMHHLLRIAGSPVDLFGPDAADEAATAHVFLLHLLVYFAGSQA